MESVEKIRKMLDRFYQGESTLEEEKTLLEFFSSSTVPEELLPDKKLFEAFGSPGEQINVPADLNRKLLDVIDREEKKESRSRRISMFSLSGLAAGLLVMIAVYLFFLRNDEPAVMAGQEWQDTYEDPMKAYEEARKTLAFVSAKLNEGTQDLARLQQANQSANRSIQSLSKINKGTRELNLLGQLQRVREFEAEN
jgi:hypothetical protein